ncbi:MAG: polyphosphate polymerase domain-containing protein [Clostridia bacterium]|nr:polyphosphate polymerase domain-containing protein [Clostridia bacterium]
MEEKEKIMTEAERLLRQQRDERTAAIKRAVPDAAERHRERVAGVAKKITGGGSTAKVAEKPYRHELKYIISEAEYKILSTRLKNTLKPDAFAAKNGGEYFIRSLYFDDPFDTALEEKFAGVQSRDKFRIRIYDRSDRVIKLERKHKEGAYIQKSSLSLSRAECDAILAGKPGFLLRRPEPFAKQMYGIFAANRITPRVIVDYTREPYVYPVEDVRITFDKNVRTAMRGTDLFDFSAPTYPATDMVHNMILEVKFNRYLPTYVHTLIQLGASQHVAASKYVACRRYEF